MCDPAYLVPDLELCSSDPAEIAVAFGDPAATEAASVARSAATADLIAIVSPAVTAVLAVMVSLV